MITKDPELTTLDRELKRTWTKLQQAQANKYHASVKLWQAQTALKRAEDTLDKATAARGQAETAWWQAKGAQALGTAKLTRVEGGAA